MRVLHQIKSSDTKAQAIFEQRPWGGFEVLYSQDNIKVKKLIINPNSRTSLQSHNYRNENWTVIAGAGTVTLGNKQIKIQENESVFIPINAVHRIENNADNPLEIIEVQTGNILSENDIFRIDDDYGRVNNRLT